MQKAATVAGLLLMCLTSSTLAIDGFKPLTAVMAEETSNPITFYMLKRCSAAYMATSTLFAVSGGAEEQQYAQIAEGYSRTFYEVAIRFNRELQIGATTDGIIEDIGAMSEIYAQMMVENYRLTGNRLEGVITEDLTLCGNIYSASSE